MSAPGTVARSHPKVSPGANRKVVVEWDSAQPPPGDETFAGDSGTRVLASCAPRTESVLYFTFYSSPHRAAGARNTAYGVFPSSSRSGAFRCRGVVEMSLQCCQGAGWQGGCHQDCRKARRLLPVPPGRRVLLLAVRDTLSASSLLQSSHTGNFLTCQSPLSGGHCSHVPREEARLETPSV